MHVPAPRLHLVRYYGHYAHVARARRRRSGAQAPEQDEAAFDAPSPDHGPSRAERRRLARGWAQLIRRIYEADPLLCPCGAQMRILSFLTEPAVVRNVLEHLRSAGREAARAPPRRELEPQALAS